MHKRISEYMEVISIGAFSRMTLLQGTEITAADLLVILLADH
jgi:hypothetical protein